MYLIKRTFRRKDASIGFFKDDAFETYQKQHYQITHDHSIVADDCMRHIQVWLNENKFKQWSDDPRVQAHIAAMEEYNHAHGITANEIKANV